MARDEAQAHRQLQEVYRHLDGIGGTTRLAWYGQLRAEEYSHAEALEMTIKYFGLESEPWYKKRMEWKT